MFVKKKVFLLAVVLLVTAVICALAESNDAFIKIELPDTDKTYSTAALEDSNQLSAAYIRRIMPSKGRLRAGSFQGAKLTGCLKNVYTLLLGDISDIADGKRSSTVSSSETGFEKPVLNPDLNPRLNP